MCKCKNPPLLAWQHAVRYKMRVEGAIWVGKERREEKDLRLNRGAGSSQRRRGREGKVKSYEKTRNSLDEGDRPHFKFLFMNEILSKDKAQSVKNFPAKLLRMFNTFFFSSSFSRDGVPEKANARLTGPRNGQRPGDF